MGLGKRFGGALSASACGGTAYRQPVRNTESADRGQRANTECRILRIDETRCFARQLGCNTARHTAGPERRPEIASLQGPVRRLEHRNTGSRSVHPESGRIGGGKRCQVWADELSFTRAKAHPLSDRSAAIGDEIIENYRCRLAVDRVAGRSDRGSGGPKPPFRLIAGHPLVL